MNFKSLKFSAIIAIAAAAVGCGGGGGGAGDATSATTPISTVSATGLWNGTTSTRRSLTGLILGDGSYWVLYSAINNPNLIAGVIQGTATSSSGSFASANAKDFNLEGLGVLPATISASYTSKQSFNGSVSYTGATTSFTSTYDQAGEQSATLATIAGSSSGQVALSAGTQTATIAVNSSGSISGSNSGCNITGSVTPRTDVNAYAVVLTFGAAPCYLANHFCKAENLI